MSENTTPTPNKLRIVLYAVLGGMLALSGELMPDDFKEKVQNFVWNNWHISFFWFWLGLIGLLTLLLIWLEIKKETPQTTPSVLGQDFEANRTKIIESFAKRYNSRYEQKLDERIALNLELKYTQIGTNQEFVDRYFTKDTKTEADIQKELIDVILKHRYILIVGQPGAGKTTLLLETAMALLDKAKQDHTALPVIFNLSSWRSDYTDFNKWLVDMLVEGNGFSKKLAEEALAKKQIIPLLDGLDELGRSLNNEKEREILRGQCLAAISQFLTQYNPEYMVICSRIEEYKMIADNAPVKAEILVKPLTIEQIENALKPRAENPSLENQRPHANITAAQNILYLLKTNPSIAETLKVPFYFHLATQVFDNQLTEHKLPKKKKLFEDYLIERFVEKRKKLGIKKGFLNYQKNCHWIKWLASYIKKQKIDNFDISVLHPDMLNKPELFNFYYIGLSMGFISTIMLPLAYSTSFGVYLGEEAFWLMFWFIIKSIPPIFLLLGVISSYFKPIIVAKREKILWDWKSIKQSKIVKKILALVYIFCYIGFSLSIGTGQVKYLSMGLICGGILGIHLGLMLYIVKTKNFSSTLYPYQRLGTNLSIAISYGVLLFLIMFIGHSFIFEFNIQHNVLYSTLLGLSMFIFLILISSFFQHIIIRLCLWIEGKLPLCLVHFLNYTTDDLRFLERDGGNWRFRHQILQDYFAGLAEKDKQGGT